ncbi:MAG: hypothetical protein ACKVOS_06615 [Sphingorhabdus sp.]
MTIPVVRKTVMLNMCQHLAFGRLSKTLKRVQGDGLFVQGEGLLVRGGGF